MDIVKCFVLDQAEYHVNVQWIDGQPLFRATDIGNVLGLRNMHTSVADFDADEKGLHSMETLGGMQQTLFLTEAGVYRLLMLSRKPIARPFQKWVTRVLISIREQGKYELELEKANTELAIREALQKQAEMCGDLVLHDSLLQAHHKKGVVYLGKVKQVDDRWIVKLGSTGDIAQRAKQLAGEFGSMTIFRVVDIGAGNRAFELYVHHHRAVAHLKFKGDVHDGKRSHETYLVNDAELQVITNLVRANTERFRLISAAEAASEVERIKMHAAAELEKVKLQRDLVQLELAKVQPGLAEPRDDPAASAVSHATLVPEICPTIIYADARQYTHAKGDKLQRYSADGKTLLKTYASAVLALRDEQINASSRLMIKKAIVDKTLYQGYRWASLKRELHDDTIQDIGDTAESTTDIRQGFVAMLNLDKDTIVDVFSDQKAAGKARKFRSGASISNAIHRGTLSGGHYWAMWHDCSDALQQAYASRAPLPDKRIRSGAQMVEKVHPVTGQVITTYASVADVLKDHAFARNSLRTACELGYIAKGYRWRMIPIQPALSSNDRLDDSGHSAF